MYGQQACSACQFTMVKWKVRQRQTQKHNQIVVVGINVGSIFVVNVCMCSLTQPSLQCPLTHMRTIVFLGNTTKHFLNTPTPLEELELATCTRMLGSSVPHKQHIYYHVSLNFVFCNRPFINFSP
jgi:hypothetical protein